MTPADAPDPPALQQKTFVVLIVAVSIAFAWILWPFYGAIFWAVVLAIVFAPLYRRVCAASGERATLASLATLLVILLAVILPLAVVTGLVVQEAASVYSRMQSGEFSISTYLRHVLDALPPWMSGVLERYGLGTLDELRARLSSGMTRGLQVAAAHAVSFGQNTFEFVVSFFLMLYLLFFFLRDGRSLVRQIRRAVPLRPDLERTLFARFGDVIRATVKGNIVVAIVQGALGGLIFWFLGIHGAVLWAVVMAFLSLLPAVGTALVWLPVAVYLLATGAVWQGALLIGYGVLVIGLVDNVLRPVLVGKDTKLPDYLVLMSTLGGMAIFGLNGFIIGPVIAAMFVAVWATLAGTRQAAPSDAGPAAVAAVDARPAADRPGRPAAPPFRSGA